MDGPPDPTGAGVYECGCPFDYPYTCPMCDLTRITNHCPHDGVQNPCPGCAAAGDRPAADAADRPVTVDLVRLDALAHADFDAYARYTDEWLRNRRLSDHTRTAYRLDVTGWLAWCRARGLEPRAARFTDLNAYARDLEATVNPRTSKPLAATTVARKLSAVSSWYAFLVKLGVLAANPAADTDRPRVDRGHSSTAGLSRAEATALLATADLETARTRALLRVLVDLGIRVSEACGATVADLGHANGHRTLTVHGKGDKTRRRALPPSVAVAIDAYLCERATAANVPVDDLTGPLFATSSGGTLDRGEVFRLVRRLARKAGIAGWARISPHSLRHAWNTIAREAGADLDSRQDAMGHVDSRTTRRYDRSAGSLDKDPAYLVAAATAPGVVS